MYPTLRRCSLRHQEALTTARREQSAPCYWRLIAESAFSYNATQYRRHHVARGQNVSPMRAHKTRKRAWLALSMRLIQGCNRVFPFCIRVSAPAGYRALYCDRLATSFSGIIASFCGLAGGGSSQPLRPTSLGSAL